MNDRRLRRTCFTEKGKPKLRFDSRAEAKAWMREMLQKYPENKPLQQYHCRYCGYYHNGQYPDDPVAREAKRLRHQESDGLAEITSISA